MALLTDEAEVAALGEGTVLLAAETDEVLRACDSSGYRWFYPGNEVGLSDAEVARAGRWVVLRHGQHDGEAAAPTDGLDSFSTDGGMLSVRRVGYDAPIPVAMCVSVEWARALATAMNAREVEAYPAVVAAVQRLADLQAEIRRQQRARDRLDDTTRERVAAILAVLGIGPVNRYGVGTTAALLAIRDEAARLRKLAGSEPVPGVPARVGTDGTEDGHG